MLHTPPHHFTTVNKKVAELIVVFILIFWVDQHVFMLLLHRFVTRLYQMRRTPHCGSLTKPRSTFSFDRNDEQMCLLFSH